VAQAFWDSLVDDLRHAQPCYVRVVRVLAEIRDGVSDIAGARESAAVHEAVDIDFIKGQAELGLYGWDSCKRLVGAVVGIIRRVQSPMRDADTQARWVVVGTSMEESDDSIDRPRVLCKALEFLLDRVNALRIDAANARWVVAPCIVIVSIAY
jgi:hypothetical protein